MNEPSTTVCSAPQTSDRPKPAPRPKANARITARLANAAGKSHSPTTAKSKAGSASEEAIDSFSRVSKTPVATSSCTPDHHLVLNHPNAKTDVRQKKPHTSQTAGINTKAKPMPAPPLKSAPPRLKSAKDNKAPRLKSAKDNKRKGILVTGNVSSFTQRQVDVTVNNSRENSSSENEEAADPTVSCITSPADKCEGAIFHLHTNGMVTPTKSSTITSNVSYDTPTQSDTDSEDEVSLSDLAAHAYDSLPESETESESEIGNSKPFDTSAKNADRKKEVNSTTMKAAFSVVIKQDVDTKESQLRDLHGSSTIDRRVSYDTPTQSDTDSEEKSQCSAVDHIYDSLTHSETACKSEISDTPPNSTIENSHGDGYVSTPTNTASSQYANNDANSKEKWSAHMRTGQAPHVYAEPVLLRDAHRLLNRNGIDHPRASSAPTTPSLCTDEFDRSSWPKRPTDKVARQLLLTLESRFVPEVSMEFSQEDSDEYVQPMISASPMSAPDTATKSLHYLCTVLPTADESMALHKSVSGSALTGQSSTRFQGRTLQQMSRMPPHGGKAPRTLGKSRRDSGLVIDVDDQDYEVMNPVSCRQHPAPETNRHHGQSITSLQDNPLYGRSQQELRKLVCQHGNCRCDMSMGQHNGEQCSFEVENGDSALAPSSHHSATNDTSCVSQEKPKTKKKKKKKKKGGKHTLVTTAKQSPGSPTWYVTL